MNKFYVIIFLCLICAQGIVCVSGPYPDRIAEFNLGDVYNPDFQDQDTVFGAPESGSSTGYSASLDVLNLGTGGSIILVYDSSYIYNGTGADFGIFENPFYVNGIQSDVFIEPAFVSVSDDGETWVMFPAKYIVQTPALTYDSNPAHYENFAGINPVFSSSSNGINPLDPAKAGGDWFDLEIIKSEAAAAGVDINHIRYIKIKDAKPRVEKDVFGNIIPGAYMPGGLNGFDLDAAAARNFHGITSASKKTWSLYE